MGPLWFGLICVIFYASPAFCTLRSTDTFEFGTNTGKVTFSESGTIGVLEKTKKITVLVPECRRLKYVRVNVDNKIGPPVVSFDSNLSAVVISYRPLQHSRSSYTVIAKSISVPYCGRHPYSSVELVDITACLQ